MTDRIDVSSNLQAKALKRPFLGWHLNWFTCTQSQLRLSVSFCHQTLKWSPQLLHQKLRSNVHNEAVIAL